MSKFRNRIRDLGRTTAGFGFTFAARAEAPRYLLVVAEVNDAAAATAAAEAGVDAVIVRGSAAALAGLDTKQVLAGVWLEDATGDEVTAAKDAGADFFLFDDGRAQASALTPTDIGRVLLLGPDQETERLRSIAVIELDAVVVTGEVGALTVRDQLALRRVASHAYREQSVTPPILWPPGSVGVGGGCVEWVGPPGRGVAGGREETGELKEAGELEEKIWCARTRKGPCLQAREMGGGPPFPPWKQALLPPARSL